MILTHPEKIDLPRCLFDFTLDFSSYIPVGDSERPAISSVLNMALQGELGLKLEPRKQTVETMIIDHVERPSGN